ncbi:catechol O-methyltransferase domain-containing protein 1-like [Oncorhynchus kisutch]|uniref:catechol O-methyltransferase domain-containing protein 1-like n=1 Tax=Oncorhynchus kisutch TaxID=8019 RepID=UPI0012DC377B|nr:catechol O-methyltransferase domain-containing protein 1-like [Oncorhynchus kisutch]
MSSNVYKKTGLVTDFNEPKHNSVVKRFNPFQRDLLFVLDELIAAGEAGTYDFVFIDADKRKYDRYYEKSLELVRQGGIIAIDNVLWSGKVVDPAPDDLTSQALDKLNKKLHTDQRIDLSMLTVGNGLTLVIKR